MTDNNGDRISLENCDFNKKKMRINSPYSLIASELIGIEQEDLFFLSRDEYLKKNQDCQNLNKELQEERYNHFNSRRRKLIEDAKKKREELLEAKNNIKNRQIIVQIIIKIIILLMHIQPKINLFMTEI